MSYANIVDILTIIFGSSALITLIGYAFQYNQHKSEKDFEARKVAQEYYMTLYGYIGVLDELTKSYLRSIQDGKAEVFSYDNGLIEVQTSEKILDNYKNKYVNFASFYLKKSCEGYEIFVSKKLKGLLIKFWKTAKIFYDEPSSLKNKQTVEKFNNAAKETTDSMEKLFGLK
ncbi:MAG: hypothetical protein ABR909_06585 [Candidatus Bathyarchaeia archaeon]